MSLVEKYTFFEMTRELVAKCNEFSCSDDKDIENYFREKNDINSSERLGRSYCFVNEKQRDIVCAFTLSDAIIYREYLPKNRKRKIQENINNRVRRKEYPAALIGQLVVFDNYRDEHLGEDLMNYIKGLFSCEVKEPSYQVTQFSFHNIGCRFLIVDATNKKKVLDYYTKNGFSFLFNSEDEEIYSIKSGLRMNLFHKILSCFRGQEIDEYRQTRLMYFDLISKKG